MRKTRILERWKKLVTLAGVLGGLCLPAQANTTAAEASPAAAVPSAVDLSTTERLVRIALLLPLQSETLRAAAEAVRAGFEAAHAREPDGISVSIVETGDAAPDVLAAYRSASTQSDVVVGPLSRSDVGAVAGSGAVDRPTIALTPPDRTATADALPQPPLPHQMLVIGLSIEDEARQLADWAAREQPAARALVFFTKSAWQRRAARAFELQWQQQGREAELVELVANDGFLNGRALLQLKKQMEASAGAPPVLFMALDARQARQVRAVMGNDAGVYYGTSQINPQGAADRARGADEPVIDMDGTRVLDIPWQLQPDHPAVMAYPRAAADAERPRNADLERLYALGIDAYRVARRIAFQHASFELDGVTGKLTVRFDNGNTHFARFAQQAVYRDGSVVPAADARGETRR